MSVCTDNWDFANIQHKIADIFGVFLYVKDQQPKKNGFIYMLPFQTDLKGEKRKLLNK